MESGGRHALALRSAGHQGRRLRDVLEESSRGRVSVYVTPEDQQRLRALAERSGDAGAKALAEARAHDVSIEHLHAEDPDTTRVAYGYEITYSEDEAEYLHL